MNDPGSFQITLKLFLLREERFLVLEDSATGEGDLPGGRLNCGELYQPFEHSLAREVLEELGPIQYRLLADPVFIFPHFVAKDQKEALGIAFLGEYLDGEIHLSAEHNEFAWASVDNPPDGFFVSYMKAAVQTFLSRKDEFFRRMGNGPLISLP